MCAGRAVRPIEGPVICTNKTRKYERGGNIVLVHIISKDREKERERGNRVIYTSGHGQDSRGSKKN